MATSNIPPAVNNREPIRSESQPLIGAKTTIAIGTGVRRIPA